VFVFLIAWRWSILRDPPFFECAMGLFTEANFLAESGFDYHRLRYEEDYGANGGPYAYMTSVLPTFVAILMRTTSERSTVFLIYHLFVIGCATIVLLTVHALLTPDSGRSVAALCAAVVATNPLFSAQIDMLGMDLPMTAFCGLSALLLLNRYYATSAIAGLLAFAMKPTGALVTMAALVFLTSALAMGVIRAWRSPEKRLGVDQRRLALGILATVFALGAEVLIYRWGGIDEKLLSIIVPGNSFLAARLVCPDLLLIGGGALVGTGLIAGRRCWRGLRGLTPAPGGSGSQLEGKLAFCWLMIGGTIAAIIRYGYVPPRYFTVLVPFLFVAVGLVMVGLRWRASIASAALGLLLAINLANGDGKFLPRLDEVNAWSRGGDRSRAYLADLRSTIEAMRFIERQCADEPIVVGHPYTYFLAFPRMGYVDHPLRGYTINAFTASQFPNWIQALLDRPQSVIFVAARNSYYQFALACIPPPEQGDEVLFRSDDPSPLIVFRKRFPPSAWQSGKAERWILENSWYCSDLSVPTEIRAELMAQRGRGDLGIELLRAAARRKEPSVAERLQLGRLLLMRGFPIAAEQEMDALLRRHPRNPDALVQKGMAAELRGQGDEALALYRAALSAAADNTAARFRLGLALANRGELEAATDLLRQCTRLEPRRPDFHDALASLLARRGKIEEARREFQEALRIDPHYAPAAVNLRRLEADQRRSNQPATTDSARQSKG
jgi:tetratricopeptide (TPR) repeat protein